MAPCAGSMTSAPTSPAPTSATMARSRSRPRRAPIPPSRTSEMRIRTEVSSPSPVTTPRAIPVIRPKAAAKSAGELASRRSTGGHSTKFTTSPAATSNVPAARTSPSRTRWRVIGRSVPSDGQVTEGAVERAGLLVRIDDIPRDAHQVHLVGAVGESRPARLQEHARERRVLRVAERAVHLDGAVHGAPERVGDVVLAHRDLGVERLAVLDEESR